MWHVANKAAQISRSQPGARANHHAVVGLGPGAVFAKDQDGDASKGQDAAVVYLVGDAALIGYKVVAHKGLMLSKSALKLDAVKGRNIDALTEPGDVVFEGAHVSNREVVTEYLRPKAARANAVAANSFKDDNQPAKRLPAVVVYIVSQLSASLKKDANDRIGAARDVGFGCVWRDRGSIFFGLLCDRRTSE